MASREIRRIRERLAAGKEKKEGTGEKKISALTIPSIVVIGLVLVGLLLIGGNNDQRRNVSVSFGAYDGRPIAWSPGNYFGRKIGEMARQHQMQEEMALRLLLPYMTFHTAVLVEAERNGLFVSDKEVEDYIARMGDEAQRWYNESNPLLRHELFEVYKEELIELKFVQSLMQSFDNQALTDAVSRMGAEEKKFRFAQWKYDDYPVQEIIKFAEENKALFRQIKLSRISLKSESEAKDARDKIVNGQSTFEEQVKAHASAGGEGTAALDWQSYHSLEGAVGGKETADKIFALKQGEISPVVAVGSEWIIYRCDLEAMAADLSATKTVEDIKIYILSKQKGRVESYFEGLAKGFFENAQIGGLSPAARTAKLRVYETGFFPLNYNRLPFLKAIPDMKDPSTMFDRAQYESVFFKEAFALKPGAVSKPILLRDAVIVCELADQRTAPLADVEKIKTDFNAYRNAEIMRFFYIIADHLYTLGLPQFYNGQMIDPAIYHQLMSQGLLKAYDQQITYNPYAVQLNREPVYLSVVDPEKLGTPAEQADMEAKGLEEFRKLFTPKEK